MSMIPGEGAEALKALRKFSPLRTDVTFSEEDHQQYAIAKCLADLQNCNGPNPLEIAILALEDNNHHSLCQVLRKLVDNDPVKIIQREAFVLRAVLSYGMSNLDDLNEALEVEDDDSSIEVSIGDCVTGEVGQKIEADEIYDLVNDIDLMSIV